jgi:hypothetical protein
LRIYNSSFKAARNEHVRIQRRYDPDGNLAEEQIGDLRVSSDWDLKGNRVLRKSSTGNQVA